MVQQAEASQKRINEFLNQEPEITNGIHRQIDGHIVFNEVSFTYPDTGIKALDEISFSVNPGGIGYSWPYWIRKIHHIRADCSTL